jgi:hypothetical protein
METLEDKPFLLAYGDKVASDKEDPAAMVSVAAAKKKTPASRIPTEKNENNWIRVLPWVLPWGCRKNI